MKIRLWKLGSLEYRIIPTKESLDTFREMLKEELKDEKEDVLDIVWGPELECQIIDTDNPSHFATLKAVRGFSGLKIDGEPVKELGT